MHNFGCKKFRLQLFFLSTDSNHEIKRTQIMKSIKIFVKKVYIWDLRCFQSKIIRINLKFPHSLDLAFDSLHLESISIEQPSVTEHHSPSRQWTKQFCRCCYWILTEKLMNFRILKWANWKKYTKKAIKPNQNGSEDQNVIVLSHCWRISGI